jgi:hypothetical protein
MNRLKKIFVTLLISAILLFATSQSFSQCSVCRASAESNVEHGYSAGRGLNSGILYLLCMPYILGGVGFFIWYKNKKKKISHS